MAKSNPDSTVSPGRGSKWELVAVSISITS